MKILLYIRPESKDYLYHLAEKLDPIEKIVSISDFKETGDYWMGFYLNKKDNHLKDFFTLEERKNIYNRCRFLRTLSFSSASKLIEKYAKAVNTIFENNAIRFILSEIIDNYCMDIIDRLAQRRSIPVISTCVTFIPGYSRFTLRGNLIKINRQVPNAETNRIADKLMDKSFKGRIGGERDKGTREDEIRHYKQFYRRYLIEKLYYPIEKVIQNDRYNYHYNTRYIKTINVHKYYGKKVRECFVHDSEKIKLREKDKAVFLPLHCTPEATTDYFCDDSRFGYYEDVIEDFVKKSDSKYKILIKEHPVMVGLRSIDFYQRLLKYPNVILIAPELNSNDIMKMTDTVVVCTGSVGVEALLRGKRVLTLSSNYYSSLHPNIHLIKYLDDENMNIPIIKYGQNKFLQELLSNFFPVQFYGWRDKRKTNVEEMAREIKKYYGKSIGLID